MASRPVDQGCAAAQATLSAPSAASSKNGVNWPSLATRPRVSWTTTAYPVCTARITSKE
jgi:hypothetical protein